MSALPHPTFRRRAAALAVASVAALAAGVAAVPGTAVAAPAPIASCGNTTTDGGVLIGDVTARRTRCDVAKRIARAAVVKCGDDGSCSVRGFTCLTARAAEELRFARCSKAGRGQELFKVVRFDFGS
ncbi:MAG TPA: hypothetical protein VGO48_16430 [Conexibacter sp.]|nr:hypothetical protein [Conexibacter sp.]